jgi:hypothetical protein
MTIHERHALERSIVLYLLDADYPEPWTLDRLTAKLAPIGPLAVRDSAAALASVGVVAIDGEQLQATAATRRLYALDLIGA